MRTDYSGVGFKNDGRLKLLIIVGTRPEIIRLAEWDTMASKMFATKVVALILKNGDLQVKEFILPVSY